MNGSDPAHTSILAGLVLRSASSVLDQKLLSAPWFQVTTEDMVQFYMEEGAVIVTGTSDQLGYNLAVTVLLCRMPQLVTTVTKAGVSESELRLCDHLDKLLKDKVNPRGPLTGVKVRAVRVEGEGDSMAIKYYIRFMNLQVEAWYNSFTIINRN